MKNFSWSYSSLDLYTQCPHKYFRLKVKRDIKEPISAQLLYGNRFHKAAENFIQNNTPLPPEFDFAEKSLDILRNRKGQHLCEYRMGLTRELTPCRFSDLNVWWRGIADLLTLQEDRAFIIDYKTGHHPKYANTKQLEILSLAVFKHFPKIKRIKFFLCYMIHRQLYLPKWIFHLGCLSYYSLTQLQRQDFLRSRLLVSDTRLRLLSRKNERLALLGSAATPSSLLPPLSRARRCEASMPSPFFTLPSFINLARAAFRIARFLSCSGVP